MHSIYSSKKLLVFALSKPGTPNVGVEVADGVGVAVVDPLLLHPLRKIIVPIPMTANFFTMNQNVPAQVHGQCL